MQSQSKQGLSVVVGLSGGVDSAVAALLLQEEGCDVTGVFMRNWDENDGNCPADTDYEDVRAVSEILGIPYYSVNFENEYMDRVFRRFIDDYTSGRTPNPDVLCNREIKFAAFLDFALASGGQALATGHYARKHTASDGTAYLLRGRDPDKDQSYFLCLLTQEQLRRAVFPVGDLLKSDVRQIARDARFPVAEKKDSTGICFIGERNFRDFLSQFIPAKPGPILTEDGEVVGEHRGAGLYTPGQRRGLGIGGRKGADAHRWFVIRTDVRNNTVYVSQSEEALYSDSLLMTDVNFIAGAPADAFACTAKVRYRQPDQTAFAEKVGEDAWRVSFSKRQRAVTPGQYCVLYDADVCLGGGLIVSAPAEPARQGSVMTPVLS